MCDETLGDEISHEWSSDFTWHEEDKMLCHNMSSQDVMSQHVMS